MAVNLSNIKDLLLPGLRGVEGKYEMIPSQYDKIFTKHNSNMALERTADMRYLGLAQLKTEGGQTAFDNNAGERYVYNQEHMEIALGYAITRKAIDDNLYKTQFAPSNLGLIESFQQTKEIYGANILNTSTTYTAAVGGDGQALCSTAHPYDGGTWANKPTTDVDLSEGTLLQAMINMAVNVHIAPSKGMTLPFISYGGSSMLALSIGMGLLLSLTRRNPYAARVSMTRNWNINS